MWTRYFVYHLRWQASAVIMMAPMFFIESLGVPLWANLMIGQAIGAVIFWRIDTLIFTGKDKKDEQSRERAI